jgi:hypothetical protein
MKELMVASVLILWVASTGVQEVSPDDIANAIAQGRAGKTLQKKCAPNGDNGFEIVVEGPLGRIMRAARDAKRQHREFTAADVTPLLGGPVLSVVTRRDPSLRAAPAEYLGSNLNRGFPYRADVVVRVKPSGSDVPVLLKPVSPIVYGRETDGGTWTIAFGRGGVGDVRSPAPRSLVPFPGSDLAASFDLPTLRAITHSTVEVVVFMSDAGEHRCKLSDGDRRAIR